MRTYKEDHDIWVRTGYWPGQMTKAEQEHHTSTHCKYCGGPLENGTQPSEDGFCSDHCRYNAN